MMFLPPRVIAIDDDLVHLQGLVDGLHRYGTACLPIHFTGDPGGIKRCPGVRMIFADLHLTDGGVAGANEQHFAVIGGLLEGTFTPAGPYALILWTRFANQADALRGFLESRLEGVAKPLVVVPLDKTVHLDLKTGAVKDPAALVTAIEIAIQGQPQLAALLRWEERVLDAAAETVAAILGLTRDAKTTDERATAVSRLLARIAIEAVGESHVDADRFGAVNDALIPILADRIAFLRPSASDTAIWQSAFDETHANAALSLADAARLNRMLHVDEPGALTASVRGSVSPLPADRRGDAFKAAFGLDEDAAAAGQFGCKSFDAQSDQFRWMLVQTQAACDFAQRQTGTIPTLLGLEMRASAAPKDKLPAAIWRSPALWLRDDSRYLHVNCRFQYPLAPELAASMPASYRLREQLLSELLHSAHSLGARPGSITFRETKAKT